MLDTGFFGSLKAKTQVKAAQVKDKAGIVWFFGLLAVSMIFSAVCYVFIMRHLYSVTTSVFPQTGPLCIGVWSACCGAFTLILIILYQQLYGKKHNVSLRDIGVMLPIKQIGKTILLAVIVVACAFGIVFFADYFFQSDFRLWVLAAKVFESDKVMIALRYLPFFLIYYVMNSVRSTVSIIIKSAEKPEILSYLVWRIRCHVSFLLLYNISASIQRVFLSGDWLKERDFLLFGSSRLLPCCLLPQFISRIIYKKTANPIWQGALTHCLSS